MAQRSYEDTIQVFFVATIADIAAPTVAELTAGTEITCFLSADGWQPNTTTNTVDADSLCTTVDGKIPGTVGYDLSLMGFRDDTTDTLWDLWIRGTTGYIVYVPFGDPGTTPAALDTVSVFRGAMNEKSLANSAKNTRQMFTAPFAVLDAELNAVVAA